jgi:hypothetical protein
MSESRGAFAPTTGAQDYVSVLDSELDRVVADVAAMKN